jgi:hypothetical protein
MFRRPHVKIAETTCIRAVLMLKIAETTCIRAVLMLHVKDNFYVY